MSQELSPYTGRAYGIQRVCRVWGVARATYYDRLAREADPPKAEESERGSGGPWLSDAQLVEEIREVISGTAEARGFHGEGYRKVWARLRHKGVRTSKRRTLRLMREHSLLAPSRCGGPRGPRVHDGTITTPEPDMMWGTDATAAWTRSDGLVTIFLAVDHCTTELVGVHAAKRADRFEALEPIRQGVKYAFDAFGAAAATNLKLRHDHGSQFTSKHFQRQLKFLGIESSPSFVRNPEGNGVAERFVRTLKEQLLWQRDFEDAEDLRQALQAFRRRYNEEWILGRHGYASPAEVRRRWRSPEKVAA
jgi:putative transposase